MCFCICLIRFFQKIIFVPTTIVLAISGFIVLMVSIRFASMIPIETYVEPSLNVSSDKEVIFSYQNLSK